MRYHNDDAGQERSPPSGQQLRTVGGKNVDWLEKVSDEQYRKR